MGTNEDFVLDMHFADWVWNHIESSPRIYWPDDERLIYQTKVGIETKKWYRDGTWDKDNWKDWKEQSGFGVPDFTGTPELDFLKDSVSWVGLAGTPYTIIGGWYTFEAQQDEGEPAEFRPIRVPVPDEMIGTVRQFAKENGGEVTRVKGVEFAERFADALDGDEAHRAVGMLNDVHVNIPNVTTEEQAKRIFTEATDYAERAVRTVM